MKSETSSQNAGGRAYKEIKDMISKYELIPGQKITYDQLAAKLKLSKTPIINALTRLEEEEFFVSVPNRGFSIKKMSPAEFENLYRIRVTLEKLSLEEFVEHGDTKKLGEIEKAMIVHRNFPYEGFVSRKRYILDAAFHLKIAESGGNDNLYRLLRQIWEQLHLRNRIEGFPPKRYHETSGEHEEIFSALKERDLKKAQRIMENHLRKCKDAALLVMQQNDNESYEL